MGLIQEVQTLNDSNKQLQSEYIRAKRELEKNQKEVEKLEKKLELAKQEKENKKEYERDLKKAVENDCIQCMRRCFEREGYKNALVNLQLAETRADILQHIPENEIERIFLDNNYEKILNKVKKIYENDQKAKNAILTQQLKEELEKSNNVEIAKKAGYSPKKIYNIEEIKELNNNITNKQNEEKANISITILKFIGLIIKWTFLILFGGIYFICKVLFGLAK